MRRTRVTQAQIRSETEMPEQRGARAAQLIAVLLLVVVVIVGFARLTEQPLTAVPKETTILNERLLFLKSSREGAVAVFDADGQLLTQWSSDDAGFVSTIARVIKRERIKRNADVDAPVKLRERSGDRLTIYDPQIDRETELKSFGRDNVEVVRGLLYLPSDV